MVIKAIDIPILQLVNQRSSYQSSFITDSTQNLEYSTNPLFEGVYSINGTEVVSHYRFQLYDITTGYEVLLEDSDWMLHDSANDLHYSETYLSTNDEKQVKATSGDQYRFKKILSYDINNPTYYRVRYSVRTQNLWEGSTGDYDFSIILSSRDDLVGIKFTGQSDNEEGVNELFLSPRNDDTPLVLTGNYVISRTDEKSNFSVWEDIKYFTFTAENFGYKGELLFTDYTIESGIQYQYALQKQNQYGLRSNQLICVHTDDEEKMTFQADFQYTYLYDNGIQLKIKYDPTMNSFKHTVLANKQDTLGSRYPIVMRNAQANYAEFPINGLLSLHSDENHHFFKLKQANKNDETNGYYYKDELVIPARKLNINYSRDGVPASGKRGYKGYSYDTNLTDDNVYIERKFREKAEEFINDGRYKLFKSPTEGNIIVGITNMSMTPNQQLGRMIYSFTSTAYEIMDYTYENLVKFGIEKKGSLADLSDEPFYKVGQLTDLVYNWEDEQEIKSLIKEQISKEEGSSVEDKLYVYELDKIVALWFEPFPATVLAEEIMKVEGEIQNLLGEGKNSEEKNAEKAKYEALQEDLRNHSIPKKIGMTINGTPIYLGYGQVYYLDNIQELFENQDSLEIKLLPWDGEDGRQYPPVLVNYIASAQLKENPKRVVTKSSTGSIWGQVRGIFTENTEYYEYCIKLQEANKKEKIPMPIYNHLNIGQTIMDQVKLEMTDWYINQNGLTGIDREKYFTWDPEEKVFYNEDESVLLYIVGYERLEVELDKFATLQLIRPTNEIEDKQMVYETQDIVVGPTSKYVIKYSQDIGHWITDVKLKDLDPEDNKTSYHCIIDYTVSARIDERGAASNV